MATAVRREFLVQVAHQAAWDLLAQAERWPEWAPHIRAVALRPVGPLGSWSSGLLDLPRFGHRVFLVSAWEPPNRWEWVGSEPGVQVHYDHRFESVGSDVTRLEWIVRLSGPLAALVRPVFAAIYGRNVDRAIPRVQAWMVAEAAEATRLNRAGARAGPGPGWPDPAGSSGGGQ